MVREGSSEEAAFKGATGQVKEAATAAHRGENFRQKENRNTTLQQVPPLSLGTQEQAQKGGSPYPGCALRARPWELADRRPARHICAAAHPQ